MQPKSQEGWVSRNGKIYYVSKYDLDAFLLTKNCREIKLTGVVHEGNWIRPHAYITNH